MVSLNNFTCVNNLLIICYFFSSSLFIRVNCKWKKNQKKKGVFKLDQLILNDLSMFKKNMYKNLK